LIVKQRRRIAAYGAVRDPDGRILLVREATRGDDRTGDWGLPGGGVEHGEQPLDAVVREFREETGLDIRVLTLRDVTADLLVRPGSGTVTHTDRVIYDVEVVGGTLRNEGDGTSDRAGWVGPERAAALPLMPYTARLLGLSVTDSDQSVEADPDIDPNRRTVQRFAAYGLVTDPTGRVLLCQIAPGYPGAGTWHLPGGGTDFGEQATAGLLRELAEEADQSGRVTGLLDVTHFHNPAAMGPEGHPMDWHTVRTLYRVVVDAPTTPRVTEVAGGSTARSAWFRSAELPRLRLNQFARSVIKSHLA
jgi:ADP-ribose pyrophosphatase YjhB (NUDIX family)